MLKFVGSPDSAQLGESVGKSGDAAEAARIFDQLRVDQRAAVWTAHAGHPSQALAALRDLLAEEEGTLGTEHANTLATRATIAQLLYETGDRDEAIEMLRQVSKDQVRVLGSGDRATEVTRRLLAEWKGDRPRHRVSDPDLRLTRRTID
jgi:hypothetical protein